MAEDRVRQRTGAPKWLGRGVSVLMWTLLAASVAAVVALVAVPRLAGAQPYTVVTGSMAPAMPPGTVVVVKPEPFDRIRQGDVITFQLESGQPDVVTHRVVGIDVVEGQTRLRTQGDANPAADADAVRPEQVRGTVWYHVPWIGYLGTLMDSGAKDAALRIIGAGLVAYAAFVCLAALIRRRRSIL